MENSRREDLLKRATKLAGSEELANRLIADSNVVVEEFAKEQSLLLKRVLENLRDKQEAAMNGLPNETKYSLANIVSLNSVEEIYTIFLLQAADCSVFAQVKCSDFIYRAADVWEKSAMHAALTSMSRGLMDMIMKARPEPPKDKLS